MMHCNCWMCPVLASCSCLACISVVSEDMSPGVTWGWPCINTLKIMGRRFVTSRWRHNEPVWMTLWSGAVWPALNHTRCPATGLCMTFEPLSSLQVDTGFLLSLSLHTLQIKSFLYSGYNQQFYDTIIYKGDLERFWSFLVESAALAFICFSDWCNFTVLVYSHSSHGLIFRHNVRRHSAFSATNSRQTKWETIWWA